jgi:hypothetical protein
MITIKAIKPNSINLNDDLDLNKAIEYINKKLLTRDFHNQIHPIENYHAIILSPYGEYINVMNRVVEKFVEAGWDAYWNRAYDARGPHYCFYVNEKHFK